MVFIFEVGAAKTFVVPNVFLLDPGRNPPWRMLLPAACDVP